jgi:predicted PurR-regulated permease PerM
MLNLIMFVALFVVAILLAVVLYYVSDSVKSGLSESIACAFMGVCIIIAIALFFITISWFAEYPLSISKYGQLRGTRDSVLSYEIIARETKSAYYAVKDISDLKLGNVSIDLGLENIKQSTNVSERLSELVKVITEYNQDINKYHSRWSNPFTKLFIAPPPEDLKSIIVSKEILK